MKKTLFCLLTVALSPSFLSAETLQEAWEIGLKKDNLIKAAHEDTLSSTALLQASKGGRLPRLNIGAGYSMLDNEPAALMGGLELQTADKQSASYHAMLSVPLYTHFQLSSAIGAASAQVQSTTFAEETARQKIKLQIAESYMAVLLGIRQQEVARSHEAGLSSHAHDVQNFFDEGVVAQNDLLAAKVALANAKQLTLQTNNRLDIAKASYNRLLHRELGAAVQLDTIEPNFPTIDLPKTNAQALRKRPELATLSNRELSLWHQAEAAGAGSGPQVAFQTGYGYRENSHQVEEGAWQAMVVLSWDIFDGSVSKNKKRAFKAKSRSIGQHKRDLESMVLLQVRQAWLDMQESQKRIVVTKETLKQADENLTVTKNRYKEGVGTNTEVLDAESMRIVNYVSFDKATNDGVLSVMRLRYAMGTL